MKFLSNAHTHSTHCDGKASIPQMIARARELGFVSLGFSGHAAQGFDPDYTMTQAAQARYFDELHALQALGGTPRLWAGLEVDTLVSPESKRAHYQAADYVIASTHYLKIDYHGEPVGVDGEPNQLKRYVNDIFDGDGLAMVKVYYDMHVNAILRDKPDIIGHFDIVRKYAKSFGLFDEHGAAYRQLALDALERVRPGGAVMELNTGSLSRGYSAEALPSTELLGAWRELGGQVTLTSDCHDPALMDFAFDKSLRLLAGLGYRSVKRLGTLGALWEDCEL